MRQNSSDHSASQHSSAGAATQGTHPENGQGSSRATSTSDAPTRSLRDMLSVATFHCGKDIQFVSVAQDATLAMPDDLVLYRVGLDDPQRVIADALSRGAAGILTEQLLPCPLPQCVVGDVDLAMATITTTLLDRPQDKLLTIGVLGSAGKTTTALLLSTLFSAQGIRTAFQTDLGCSDGLVQSTPSTPSPTNAELVRWIGESADCQTQVAIIELSNGDLRHGRYDCVGFDLLVVTGSATSSPSQNQDDYGPTALLCAIDSLNPDGVVVASADDKKSMQTIRHSGVNHVSYGTYGQADVTAKVIDQAAGVSTLLVSHDDTTAVMETSLCGGAMAANHAAAAAVGLLTDFQLPDIARHLGSLNVVPGRGQMVSRYGHATVILDAAGCPQRSATALRSARMMKAGGKLWCVAAIENAKDSVHLARLGNLLERFADKPILTSVPGEKESFLSASHHVLDGVEKMASMRLVTNQDRAIQWALSQAKPQDTILVLMNQPSDSAHQARTRLAAIEKMIEQTRDQQEVDRPKPNLKVFG